MFKVNKKRHQNDATNTRKKCEICSKLTIKTPEWRHRRHFGVYIVNFELISHIVLVLLLLTLNMQILAGKSRLLAVNYHCRKKLQHSSGFSPNFFSWLYLTFLDFPLSLLWLSLILARNELHGSRIFPKSKFKEFQGENLYNFKEILLKIYDCQNKAIFNFAASFSTPAWYQTNVLQLHTQPDEHSWKHWLT